ncbi:hypothetical protein M0R45_005443 [Rubus argutus]|uniref:Uncharacterized protein n=1 Tax=Rubus argutus TaxID=59490 RepID=A0AAW1YMG7_RUBAR
MAPSDSMVCPKPHHLDVDNILGKGFFTEKIVSPDPFISGSPPSRVANPLIHDARFQDDKLTTMSPLISLIIPPLHRASFGSKWYIYD